VEKFKRVEAINSIAVHDFCGVVHMEPAPPPETPALLNAHSDAIETMDETLTQILENVTGVHALQDLARRMRESEHRLLNLEQPVGPGVYEFGPAQLEHSFPGLSAEKPRKALVGPDPAEVVQAEGDRMVATFRDEQLRTWTRALTAIFVAVLQDAEEGDDAD